MLRLAHRGDWRHARENTLPALAAALAVPGCDGVEFDVRVSADGVPVLGHDETLERVYGRAGRFDALTARELEDAGIPSLADALALVPHRAAVDVDLKGLHDRAVVEVLAVGSRARIGQRRRLVVPARDARASRGSRAGLAALAQRV